MSDIVFAVVFFALVLFGFWCLTGGPMRRGGADTTRVASTGNVAGGVLSLIGWALVRIAGALWGLLAHLLRGRIVERRARQLGKDGGKAKH